MSLKVTARTSKAELLAYANDELGIKLDDAKTKDELVAEIRAIEKENGIVDDNAPDDDGEDKPKQATKPGKVHEFARIRIHQPPSPDEESEPDTHCIVGFNGRNYQVEYDAEVKVPYGVYDILNNAKQVKYFTKKDPQTGLMQTHSKTVQRYPFSLIELI